MSVLLMLALVTSGSACVAGYGNETAPFCSHAMTRQTCTGEGPSGAAAMGNACRDILKSLPGRCGMRSFVQFQFVTFIASEISIPLQHTTSNLWMPLESTIVVSSIGSPETDRGPPRS